MGEFLHLPRHNVEVRREGWATDPETTGRVRYPDGSVVEFIHRRHRSEWEAANGAYSTGGETYQVGDEQFESFGEMTNRFRPPEPDR